MDDVRIRWAGKRQFVGWDQAGHGVVMDSTLTHGGEGSGVRPLELVLYGLAGCTAMDVISILEKKRQSVSALEIHVQAEQRTDDYPKIYERINIHFVVSGRDVADTAVARSIELSEEKYCSVRGMLGPQVDVTTSFEVREAAPENAD
ncbi:MAG: OsmC family protein [Coriobacteriia bacterium]|nr:OsmC family protein [Coriobacteriia bacterium]